MIRNSQRGRGGGGGKRPYDSNRDGQLPFSLNCFCVWCGKLMENQALKKTAECQNPNCQMHVPARDMPSMRSGWIHCKMCDRFTHPAYYFCLNCGCEAEKGTSGFMMARRRLMSQNPNAIVEGKTVSLAKLGGQALLQTPKKVETKRVVVYSKKTDTFDLAGDELLSTVDLNFAIGAPDGHGSATVPKEPSPGTSKKNDEIKKQPDVAVQEIEKGAEDEAAVAVGSEADGTQNS